VKMRTPAGVAYRYKNRSIAYACAVAPGVSRFPTVLAHAASRQPWHRPPPQCDYFLSQPAPLDVVFRGHCTCIDTCRGQRYILLMHVQVHPIEGRVGLKSKHSGQLGNCVAAAAQD
jgi:hypothetical protein